MTSEKDVEVRLAELRTRFLTRSRHDRAYLDNALAALAEGDESESKEMHRITHVLAGTAGTFGFARLSAAADDFEAALITSPEDRERTLSAGKVVLAELADIEGVD